MYHVLTQGCYVDMYMELKQPIIYTTYEVFVFHFLYVDATFSLSLESVALECRSPHQLLIWLPAISQVRLSFSTHHFEKDCLLQLWIVRRATSK